MDKKELTKDSDALICALYKEYLQKRKDGVPKGRAKVFGGASTVRGNLVPKWSVEDVEETLRELSRAKLMTCIYADDTVYEAILSDQGIIYMENRFKNGISGVLEYLEKIKTILLW